MTMKRLNDLLDDVRVLEIENPNNPVVSALTYDSRTVECGSCFFAVRGTQSDGHRYIASAIERGAVAIICEELPIEEARARGAMGLFGDKYNEIVKLYTMGDVSCEICGGPHAGRTGELKSFKILKEESSSRGVRRIKAVIGEAALK